MKRYDIFISYRRSSYESANLIATRLRASGYRVFFDLETMRSGPFNTQLFDVIEKCKDFVLVLPPNALDRCVDEDDWVRKEVVHALKNGKNIIPILLNGFKWPEPMPSGMENLSMFQGVAASIDYFDLAMQRLESYFKSRKYTRQRLFIRWVAAIGISVGVLLASLFLVFRSVAKPICEEVVNHLTLKVAFADFLISDNKILIDAWANYQPSNKEDIHQSIALVNKNLNGYKSDINTPINLSSWQKFLLLLYNSNTEEFVQIDIYVASLYSDLESNVEQVQNAVSKAQLLPSDYNSVKSVLDIYPSMGKALYYSYLQLLNKFPESSLEGYYELAPKFENMPDTGLGLRDSEYDILIKQAYEGTNTILQDLEDNISADEDELYYKERELDSLNNLYLAKYKEFVKGMSFDADRGAESDWGGILVISAFLDLAIDMHKEAIATGDDPGPLTPQLILSDLNKALDDFQTCYQEVNYVSAAKEFYKQVVEGLPFGGVLITQFAPETTHKVYQIGDIIVEWNGERVCNLDELKAAYAKSSSGKLKLLRLENGKLKEHSISIPGNEDIVAFCNLIDPE